MTNHADQLLAEAMRLLAQAPGAVFLGQSVRYGGAAMFKHFVHVPMEQRIEFPVAENLQLGTATGLAIQGFLPIAIFPRLDFLLLAMDQLVNHLDKLEAMSQGQYRPKVIIRTRVGSKTPLDAGPQHTQDHTEALRLMLTNVAVCKITSLDAIISTYQWALERPGSTLVVEALPC